MEKDIELREQFRSLLNKEICESLSDDDVDRFIRARKRNVEKAVVMAKDWWVWYNEAISIPGKGEVSPRDILSHVEDPNEPIYQRLMPHSNFGIGKDGHPIYWEETGVISTRMREINTLLTIDDLVIRHIRQQEIAVARMKHYSETFSKPITSQIIVMNLVRRYI